MAGMDDANLGHAKIILFPGPDTQKKQPTMLTKQFNPREAPIEEVVEFINHCHRTKGRLDRENWKFALTVMVDPKDIANLTEIRQWASGSSNAMVDVVWTITDADGNVTSMILANGNHRKEAVRKMLQAQFEELANLAMWVEDFLKKANPTPVEVAHKAKADRDIKAIWVHIERESTFAVELFDRGEYFILSL